MEIFCLNGYENGKIQLELIEIFGFPEQTSHEGGYDILCRLLIQVGSYSINCDRLYSATGALYIFSDELKKCYAELDGKAEYKLLFEKDLSFEVAMTSSGRAVVTGTFQERPDKKNVFLFEMETDQSCFPAVFQGIDRLKDTYGDALGKRKSF